MKCISRSTLGVIIGTINLLVYIGSTIFIIITLVAFNTMLKDGSGKGFSKKTVTHDLHNTWDDDEFLLTPKEEEKIPVIALSNILFTIVLVVCVIMIIISSLLIAGIVKRRHSFMAPWLILSAIGFVCSCIKTVFGLCEGVASDIPFGKVLTAFIANSLVLGLEALILYPIYTLYKDIRDRNNERPGQVISARQVGFTSDYAGQPNYYTPVSQKV